MNKHISKISVIFGLIIIFSLAQAAATHATYDISDSWSYQEDISGENRGFSLTHKSTIPRNYNCDFYDWTADGRNCAKNRYYNGYDNFNADDFGYSLSSRNQYSRYSRAQTLNPIDRAFNTFQADSQAEIEFQRQKIAYPRVKISLFRLSLRPVHF